MPGMIIGVGAAVGSAILYAVGIVLQAGAARSAPVEDALRLALFRRLVRSRRWLAGTALGLLGWALQTVALLHAPLTLVQPLLGLSLCSCS